MSDSGRNYRKSDHAEQRKNEGRPISTAFSDVQRSIQSDIFLQYDGRYIVRGLKGREHVYEANGALVTSYHRSHQVHLSKVRNGERQPVTVEQYLIFKEMFP